jgi:outer membrane protein assembly factor BamB
VGPAWTGDFDLSAFRHTRTHLFFLQGERRLFALDAQNGRVSWSHWAPGGQVRPAGPAGRFNPFYHADDQWVVIQAGNQRLVLDSRTGRLTHAAAGDAPAWTGPPLALANGCLCLPAGAGRVVLFDPATGKEAWTYRAAASGTTTLTGEAPRLVGDGRTVLVLLSRNQGYQLTRLDPRTGAPLWKTNPPILHEALDAGLIGLDDRAVYYVSRSVLYARSLADGKRLWSRPLPRGAAAWRVVSCRDHVLAYPVRVRDGARGLVFPVLFHDARDGRLVQRLNFPAPAREGTLQMLPNGLVAGAAGQAWGLAGTTARRSG